MSDKLKNVLIGLFALMGITVIVGVTLFLQPSVGDGKKTLNVRFSNVSGISSGTRVTLAGKPIGEVFRITKVEDARKHKTDEFGRLYFYELKLKVDSSVDVYDTDVIAIQTTGLMGEKSIGITPRASKKDSKLITNNIIFAKSVDTFENTAQQIAALSDKAEKTFDNFNGWFDKNSKSLTIAIGSISNLLNDFDNQNVVTSLHQSISSFNRSISHVNKALKLAEDNNSFDKLNMLVDNLALTSQSLNAVQGTIGKIINSDDLYLKISAILGKANTLFNDVNQYGVLFQYSKGWQRLRTKRANILQSISSAKDFRSYFETEVSDITASLGRINTLVEKAQNSPAPQREKIINSENFKKNYAYLLKQIESLLSIVKLYNEDVVDSND
ncbi:MAG: hypothetical protein K940chlam1_00848 [Candidatus Anoxychlamydiales bacterium]|nr:hypothetical protein [Candidatus Anoxychlamydiales bacterium]